MSRLLEPVLGGKIHVDFESAIKNDTRAKTPNRLFLWSQFSNPSRTLCVIVGWAGLGRPRPEAGLTPLGWAGLSHPRPEAGLTALGWAGLGWAVPPPARGWPDGTGLGWAGLGWAEPPTARGWPDGTGLSWAGLG